MIIGKDGTGLISIFFLLGGDILVRVETNCLLKIYFENWVKMYIERKQYMMERVKIFMEKIEKM